MKIIFQTILDHMYAHVVHLFNNVWQYLISGKGRESVTGRVWDAWFDTRMFTQAATPLCLPKPNQLVLVPSM